MAMYRWRKKNAGVHMSTLIFFSFVCHARRSFDYRVLYVGRLYIWHISSHFLSVVTSAKSCCRRYFHMPGVSQRRPILINAHPIRMYDQRHFFSKRNEKFSLRDLTMNLTRSPSSRMIWMASNMKSRSPTSRRKAVIEPSRRSSNFYKHLALARLEK